MPAFFRILFYTWLGAVAFWGPRNDIMASLGCIGFPGSELLWEPLLVAVACFWTLMALGCCGGRPLRMAAWMVLGIWLLGPLNLSYQPGGYVPGLIGPQDWRDVARAIAVFPVATWRMATDEGSLNAVLLATATLPLLALWAEYGQPQLRRRLRARKKQKRLQYRATDDCCFVRCAETGRWVVVPAPAQSSADDPHSAQTHVTPAPPPEGRGSEPSPVA